MARGTTRERGLSAAEARRRFDEHGSSLLRETKRRFALAVFVAQLESVVVALLGGATAVSCTFGEHVEGFAILAVLFPNTPLGAEVRS